MLNAIGRIELNSLNLVGAQSLSGNAISSVHLSRSVTLCRKYSSSKRSQTVLPGDHRRFAPCILMGADGLLEAAMGNAGSRTYSTTFQLAMFQVLIAKRGLIATFSGRIRLLSA